MQFAKKLINLIADRKKPKGVKEILKPIDPKTRIAVVCGAQLVDNAGCPSDVPCGGLV